LDAYGEILDQGKPIPAEMDVTNALKSFIGELDQVPPIYSAISVGGVRAYKLARNGDNVELKTRKVTVYDITLIKQHSADTFVVDIKCSGGTYIRSLARDIAKACGTIGYMSALIRLQSGCFDIEHAYTLDEIRQLKEKCIVDVMYPLQDVEEYHFDDKCFDDINFGRKIKCPFDDGYKKIYCKGIFFGLGKNQDGYLKIEYYLKNIFEE